MSTTRQIISTEMFEILEKFGSEDIVNALQVNVAARHLLRKTQAISQLDKQEQDEQIEELRKLFLKIYQTDLPIVFIMDMDFKKLIYNILIKLAEQFPANIIFAPIHKNDQFCAITGENFSIDYLIEYNRKRPVNDSLEEKPQEKFLFNPITEHPFFPMDMERLILLAVQNKKNVDFLIDKSCDLSMGPADLSKSMRLKYIALMAHGKLITLGFNPTYTLQPDDAISCILLCEKNREWRTKSELLNALPRRYKDLLSEYETCGELGTITKLGIDLFISLLTKHNEPKTLRDMADLAIAANIDLNDQYSGVLTAMHFAAQYGSFEAMTVLLDPKYHININARNHMGETAVNVAMREKKYNIVNRLAERGANLMIPNYNGIALIHMVAEYNNIEIMEILLTHQVQINQKSGLLKHEKTAAHFAAQSNSKEVTAMLLNAGADFNITSRDGFTPLHDAAYFGSLEVMQLFLKNKDKISPDQLVQTQISGTAATIAAERGHVLILALMAEEKVDLCKSEPNNGETPLHRAVSSSQYESVVFLMDHYNNIFVKNLHGLSPFHQACKNQNWDIAKLFLNRVSKDQIPVDDKELIKIHHGPLGLVDHSAQSNAQLIARLGVNSLQREASPENTANLRRTLQRKLTIFSS